MPVDADWEFEYNGLVFGRDEVIGVTRVEGLQSVDAREDITTKAGGHGAFVFGYYLDIRRVIFEGDIFIDPSLLQTYVDQLNQAFTPVRTSLPLKFQYPGAGVRYVNCVRTRLQLPTDFDYHLGKAIWRAEFVAGDPRIYSDTVFNQDIFPDVADSSGVDFDIDFDFSYGGGASGEVAITNAGSFPSPPVVRIVGPASNPKVTNLTSGELLQLNMNINTGEFVDIDTLAKTVMLGGTASRYAALDSSSRWWQLAPGQSTIRFDANGYSPGVTKATVTWRSTWI